VLLTIKARPDVFFDTLPVLFALYVQLDHFRGELAGLLAFKVSELVDGRKCGLLLLYYLLF